MLILLFVDHFFIQ